MDVWSLGVPNIQCLEEQWLGGLTLGRSSAWAVTCIYKQLPLGPGASQGGQGASGRDSVNRPCLGRGRLDRSLPQPAQPALLQRGSPVTPDP